MRKTIVKTSAVALPQKQEKTPCFQVFLHSPLQCMPVNIGVHRPSHFQPSIFSRKITRFVRANRPGKPAVNKSAKSLFFYASFCFHRVEFRPAFHSLNGE